MMRQWKRWMMLMGVLCVLSFGISGCGNKNEDEGNETKEEVVAPETEGKEGESRTDSEEEIEWNEEPDTKGADSPEEEGESQSKEELGDSILRGDIKEIDGTQFTVIENKTEETEDGEIMISPSGGDDSDFAKVSVICDEDTIFYTRTIYDGGKRYEDSDATIEDLAVGSSIAVWGNYEKNMLYAQMVQIIEVVF